MIRSDYNGDIFVSPYDEYFHTYNPLISQERETELRRRMGEEQHLFGSEGAEAGCCARRRAAWLCAVALLLCIAAVLLLLHFEKLGP